MQNSAEDQFLFQTSVQAPVADTISQLACIHNLRHRITRLKLEGEELAKYGPAKHPEKQGIDQYSDQAVEKGEFYCMDPTGRRTGNGKLDFFDMQSPSATALLWCGPVSAGQPGICQEGDTKA